MTKPLRKIKNDVERDATIRRRIAAKTKGLGYWSAIDAMARKAADKKAKLKIVNNA